MNQDNYDIRLQQNCINQTYEGRDVYELIPVQDVIDVNNKELYN